MQLSGGLIRRFQHTKPYKTERSYRLLVMSMYYPVVLFPAGPIDESLKKTMERPVFTLEKPQREYFEESTIGGWIALPGIIMFLGCFLFRILFGFTSSTILLTGLALSLIGMVIGKVEEYFYSEKEVASIRSFNKKVNRYNSEMIIHNKKVKVWNRYFRYKNASAAEKRMILLRESDIEIIEEGSYTNTRRGVTEITVERRLKKIYGRKIKVGKCVRSKYEHVEYYPDFIYKCDEYGIIIDIEIDEPYTLETRRPIHIVHYDKERNDFFVLNHWAVVRFSEQQILQNLDECLELLNGFICSIKRGETEMHIPSSIQLPRWDEDASLEMIKRRVRENAYRL